MYLTGSLYFLLKCGLSMSYMPCHICNIMLVLDWVCRTVSTLDTTPRGSSIQPPMASNSTTYVGATNAVKLV